MMDLSMEIFKDQGPVFWASVAAIALGLTILAVTGFVYFRGILVRTLGSRRQAPASRPVEAPAEPVAAPAEPVPAPAPSPAPVAEIDLQALLDRLQAAAARLEELGRQSQSPLKDSLPDVEYVFKKGVG